MSFINRIRGCVHEEGNILGDPKSSVLCSLYSIFQAERNKHKRRLDVQHVRRYIMAHQLFFMLLLITSLTEVKANRRLFRVL